MRNEGFKAPTDTPLHLPNCGMLAVAMACNVSFSEAIEAFNDTREPGRRKFGKGWKGRTTLTQRHKAIEKLGRAWSRWHFGRDRTLYHLGINQQAGWPFIVDIPGHCLTMLNGVIYDQRFPNGVHVSDMPTTYKRRKVEGVTYIKGSKR